MSSASLKQPVKKRHIDDIQEDPSLPGPSKEVLPLVAPQLIKKSSKDVNRGMYPYSKHRKLVYGSNDSSPHFVKASQLRRTVPVTKKEGSDDSAASDEAHADISQSSDSKDDRRSLNPFPRQKKLRKKSAAAGVQKITRFFKHSPAKAGSKTQPAKTKNESSLRAERESRPSVATKSSGWEWKEEKMSETLSASNENFFKRYRDCYGLVENPPESTEDYFRTLPTHILETILCQIPIWDLLNCRLVCSRWRDTIDNRKFMEWKKVYYKYKHRIPVPIYPGYGLITDPYTAVLKSVTVDDCIPGFLRFFATEFNRLPSVDMRDLLTQNAKGELADQVLTERFPEYGGKESRVWCQFVLAIFLCETVWEIFEVYKSLFMSRACSSQIDVIDAMYCLAAFLLYFRNEKRINSGLHYRLYYCLYLIENNVPDFQKEKLKFITGLPGQQSMHNYSKTNSGYLTYEQIRILNHQFDMNQKIRIIALAGTGKTTTLLHLSKLYPQIKFLNLVFNKSVNEESKKKFPQNVTCKTAHSLAFAAVGKHMRHKLTSTLRPYDLIGHLKHNEEHIQIYTYANLVLATINNFVVSSSTVMGLIHVPTQDFSHKLLSFANRDRILMDAYKIWQKMTDESDPFRITHDVYLKLYHLRKPNLEKYQCIMVDEAQDCNPVILDIVLKQTMPVIFVGDPNQQVYGFRGAQNALQCITSTHTYHLTKSFRFGPEIAYLASCVLELLLDSKKSTIVGNTSDSFINGKVGGQYAIISRTNIVLFNEALRMIVFKQLKSSEPAVINATFAGGFNSYGFDQITDIYNLKALSKGERRTNDRFISRFKTYTDLVNYAKYSADADLLSKIEIVNQHGHDISRFISILKEKCNHPIERANVVFSTTHKAKGLEFDTVCLTDDYTVTCTAAFFDDTTEEANILYVALTRAKRCLLLPEKITKLLHLAHEKFEYPVATKTVLKDKTWLTCVCCDERFVPHTVLLLVRRQTIMASGRKIEGGPLCIKCGSNPHMRPDVHMNGLIMYLDPTQDNAHRFMSKICGPLPTDPPITYDRFAQYEQHDRIFVINLNML